MVLECALLSLDRTVARSNPTGVADIFAFFPTSTISFFRFALFLWSLSIAYLLFLPHLFCTAFLFTGLSALFSCLLYLLMSPCQLRIGFVGQNGNRINMDMTLQWAFYLVFACGKILKILEKSRF